MSFVFGGRCVDGLVMAADRRILRGLELGEETEKIFSLGSPSAGPGQGLVVSFAGIQDFGLRLMDVLREKRSGPIHDLVLLAKTTLRDLWDANKEVLRDDARVDALIAGGQDGRWHLFLVSCEGWSEETSLECLGDGGTYARSLARTFWDGSLSVDDQWPVAVFLIGFAQRVHVGVGGMPSVILLRDGGAVDRVDERGVADVLSRVDGVAVGLRQALRDTLM